MSELNDQQKQDRADSLKRKAELYEAWAAEHKYLYERYTRKAGRLYRKAVEETDKANANLINSNAPKPHPYCKPVKPQDLFEFTTNPDGSKTANYSTLEDEDD